MSDDLYFRGSERRLQGQTNNNLAEQGAQRLEALGPEGQQWAATLRQDPRAALALAEQYGGLAQIELGLRYANSAGQDRVDAVMQYGGPEAFQQYGQAVGDIAGSYKDRAIWGDPDRPGSGLLGGGLGDGSRPAVGTDLDALKLGLAVGSEDPVKIQGVQDRARYRSGWKHSELLGQQEDFEKRLEPFDNLEEQLIMMEGLNPEIPLDVLQMVNMFQRNIDEGIVRGEDVRLQQFATMSGWEAFKAKAISMIDSGEAIPTEMGRKLQTSLNRQLRDKSQVMQKIVEDIDDFAESNKWGDAERAVAIPRRLQAERNLERVEQKQQTNEAPAEATPRAFSRSEAKETLSGLKPGDVTTINGVTFMKTGPDTVQIIEE